MVTLGEEAGGGGGLGVVASRLSLGGGWARCLCGLLACGRGLLRDFLNFLSLICGTLTFILFSDLILAFFLDRL